MAEQRTIHCVVIAPKARILDCKTTSVILPAHDGLVGILYNHTPMFCELGLGIMEVRGIASEDQPVPKDTFLLIDGGLVLISLNVVTVIAYDALTIQDVLAQKPERILKDILARPLSEDYSLQQRQHDISKSAFIEKLAHMSRFSQH